MMYRTEQVEWDGKETLVIDGHRFGVALMIDPTGELWDGPTRPSDTECNFGWFVSIVLENGAVICVQLDVEDGLALRLRAPGWPTQASIRDVCCSQSEEHLDEPLLLFVEKGQIVPFSRLRARDASCLKLHSWSGCDPEWAAEHINRLSKMKVVMPENMTPTKWARSLEEALKCQPLDADTGS